MAMRRWKDSVQAGISETLCVAFTAFPPMPHIYSVKFSRELCDFVCVDMKECVCVCVSLGVDGMCEFYEPSKHIPK